MLPVVHTAYMYTAPLTHRGRNRATPTPTVSQKGECTPMHAGM